MPTSAKADRGPARQVKNATARVANREFTFHSDRTIIVDSDFRQTLLLSIQAIPARRGSQQLLAACGFSIDRLFNPGPPVVALPAAFCLLPTALNSPLTMHDLHARQTV